MSKFYFEKTVSAILPIFVFLSFIALFFYAIGTVALVPPGEEAPFVQEMVAVHKKQALDKPKSLKAAHRSESEIKNYLMVITSEILSFNRGNFSETVKKIRPYFTDAGFQKYQKYLLDSGIAETVRTQDVGLSTFVDAQPFFVTSSVMNEVYKWVYDVPVVINYKPLGRSTDSQTEQSAGNEVYVRLQLTRAHDPDNEFNGIKIEDWNIVRR